MTNLIEKFQERQSTLNRAIEMVSYTQAYFDAYDHPFFANILDRSVERWESCLCEIAKEEGFTSLKIDPESCRFWLSNDHEYVLFKLKYM